MTYENLQRQYDYLNIKELDLSDVAGLKGLCLNDNIAIEQSMTQTEKACVLAEELGHYYTTVGDILDQHNTSNRKQEHTAQLWAYDKIIGLSGIIKGYQERCQNRYELAACLGVTEEFLQEAIDCYREKYGPYIQVGKYAIVFEPALAVIERL